MSESGESHPWLTRVARRWLLSPHRPRRSTAPRQKSRISIVSPRILAIPSLRSLRLPAPPPHSRKASLATPRRNSVGCLRMCLRLCLRVAKIRTFAPLLVPLRCAGTIALLSDFCSAGWRLPPHFYRKASLATPRRNLWGVCFLPHAKNQRFFPRGPRLCLRLCPVKYRSRLCARGHFMGCPCIPSLRLDVIF